MSVTLHVTTQLLSKTVNPLLTSISYMYFFLEQFFFFYKKDELNKTIYQLSRQ